MEFSIRRLYRDSVILLCAALLVLLVASMTLVSFFDQRRDRRQELAMQARMIALDVAGAREHFSMKSLIASAGTNSLLVLG